MKRIAAHAALLAALLIPLSAWAEESNLSRGARRFGLFVGANNGGQGRSTLRYAVSDARTVSGIFREMGGIAREDNVLLIEPTLQDINARLDTLQNQALEAKETYKRTEIVFYYSGHADEDGLLLGRERLGYRELRERINNIPSDMRIVILDSCSSGAFTRAKGGVKTQPFMIDSSLSAEGYAFLTSSSANEVSQESDAIKSSYFTHSLVAGLRGAADTLGDGRVSLNEVYRFAYADTLAKTETSRYGAQHPSYDMQISGTGDVILTDIREISASLMIDAAIQGRLSIRGSGDHLVAELSKSGSKPMELGLEPGRYRVTLQEGNSYSQADATVQRNQQNRLTRAQFREISPQAAVPRGPSEDPEAGSEEFYAVTEAAQSTEDSGEPPAEPQDAQNVAPKLEPFSIQFVPFLALPRVYSPGERVSNLLILGAIAAQGWRLQGIGAAGIGLYHEEQVWGVTGGGIYGITWGNHYGVQTGGVFALGGHSLFGLQTGGVFAMTLGNLEGAQAGGVFTYAGGSVKGLQTSGVANMARWNFSGLQSSGGFNYAGGGFDGLQAAPLNISRGLTRGLQFGVINYGGKGDNLQIGVINISGGSKTIPLGIINIVKDGLLHPAITVDDMEFINFSFRSGSKHFYTIFLFGRQQFNIGEELVKIRDPKEEPLITSRGGFGFEYSAGKLFGNLDFLFGSIMRESQLDDQRNSPGDFQKEATLNAQIRLSGGFKFWKHFAIYGGVTYNYLYRLNENAPLPPDTMAIRTFNEGSSDLHRLGFFAGVQF